MLWSCDAALTADLSYHVYSIYTGPASSSDQTKNTDKIIFRPDPVRGLAFSLLGEYAPVLCPVVIHEMRSDIFLIHQHHIPPLLPKSATSIGH